MNQLQQRLRALTLLDRALDAAADTDIAAAIDGLDPEATEALASALDGGTVDVAHVRAAANEGRVNGGLEGIAYALTEKCLDDCIAQLGDSSDDPSAEELNGVLPGLIERHGVGITRMMLASVNVGDAPAGPLIRDILKHHEQLALPPVVETATVRTTNVMLDPQAQAARDALKAKRQEAKLRKQSEARARREQSARARHRA